MIVLRIILYIIFGLSVLLPVYTYFIYPLVLKLLKDKKYVSDSISPYVTAIICFGRGDNNKKIDNIKNNHYKNIQIIADSDINKAISKAEGEILLFLDDETELDNNAIDEIVKPFADSRVDMVVGKQTCKEGNSLFWKYETKTRKLESKIGSVSGANNSLFAVRKEKMFAVPNRIKNIPFYISTMIKQNGGDVIYCDAAFSFEKRNGDTNFKKHIEDASGYWQALVVFWRMLFPRKGCFVYVNHRVMKYFVWLNMVTALLTSTCLCFFEWPWIIVASFQMITYVFLLVFDIKKPSNYIKKIVYSLRYFLIVNVSYFLGLFSC